MAAIGQSDDVHVFDTTDGHSVVPDLKVDFGGADALAFSPDGSGLLVVSTKGDVATVDLCGDTKLGRRVE